MTDYYYETKNKNAVGYIKQCIIDAYRSEGIEPINTDLEVFSDECEFYKKGFSVATIEDVPVDKILMRIDYRINRNGKKYGIFKKYKGRDGQPRLYPVKYVQAIIGRKVDKSVVDEEQDILEISAENVRNMFLCAHPRGELFLSKDQRFIINTSAGKEDEFEVYENKKRMRRGK